MLLTIEQAAARLGYHYASVCKLVREGALPCVEIGQRMKLIPEEAVKAYLPKRKGWQGRKRNAIIETTKIQT